MVKIIQWYEYRTKKIKYDFEKDFFNKPVCLGLSELGLLKVLMYEFWYT